MSHAVQSFRHPTMTSKNEDDDAKPYVIVSNIGKGSFAIVYKGYHEVSKERYSSRELLNNYF